MIELVAFTLFVAGLLWLLGGQNKKNRRREEKLRQRLGEALQFTSSFVPGQEFHVYQLVSFGSYQWAILSNPHLLAGPPILVDFHNVGGSVSMLREEKTYRYDKLVRATNGAEKHEFEEVTTRIIAMSKQPIEPRNDPLTLTGESTDTVADSQDVIRR
jgi:hypothetical protein